MNYPDDAKALASGMLAIALAKTLHDMGLLKPDLFLGNVAGAAQSLAASGNVIAAEALRELVEPLAGKMGFSSEAG